MSTPPQSSQVRPHKKYDREFLLGLRFADVSMRKPDWLPHISDVVIDKPSKLPLTPRGAGPLKNLNCGADFTPPFISRGRQFVGGRGAAYHAGEASQYLPHPPRRVLYRDTFQKPRNLENFQLSLQDNRFSQYPRCEEPRKVIPGVPLGSDVQLNRAENAWRPAVWKTVVGDRGEAGHEAAGTQELLCRMRSILNKLTPERFHPLACQVASLSINTAERLRGVVGLVFEKAISEPKFSVTYANMCRCLMELKVPAVDSSGDTLDFCTLLLDLCWNEFKKIEESDKFEKKQEDLNAISTEEERQRLREELDAEADAHRRRLLGNTRFVGELFKLKLVRETVVQDCIAKLLIKETEEALECLCCLLSTSGKNLDCDKAKPHMDKYFKHMEKIVKEKKTSSRIRFLLQDVLELRQNNWVPRREDHGPKTIEQIHQEAEEEKQQEQIKVQQQLLPKRNSWSHGSPHPAWGRGGSPQDEGWISSPVSFKHLTVDAGHLSRITKLGALDINNLLFIPGGEGTWRNWSRGSNGGSGFKRSGEPELGCFPSSPMNCCSPIQKPLSFTPTPRSSDSYRRVSPRNSWYRDSVEHRNRFERPEHTDYPSDHFEHQDDRRPERRWPLVTKSSHSWETEECVREKDNSSGATHRDRDCNRGRHDRGGVCNSPGRPLLPSSTPYLPDMAHFGQSQPVQTQPTTAQSIPSQPDPTRLIMTEEKVEKKSKAIIEEYLHIDDIKEALLCVQEMDCAPLLFVFVRHGIESALDHDTTARERTGHLLHQLVKAGSLPAEQFYKGMQEILEVAEDMAIDVPHIWLYLAEILTPVLLKGGLPMGQLFREVAKPLVPLGRAVVLLVEIVLLLCKAMSHEAVEELWKNAGLSWRDFLSENEDISEAVIEKICRGCSLTHCPLRT